MLVFITSLACIESFAQSSINVAGNEAKNTSGSISFSIGLTNYVNSKSSNGNISEGIQHAYEILTLTGQDIKEIALGINVYPNPTSNYAVITTKNSNYNNLNYVLIDMLGKNITRGLVLDEKTNIDMTSYPIATYILKIYSAQKELKSFKIIRKD